MALEEMATHIGSPAEQTAVRLAALEMVRARVEALLTKIREQTEQSTV
jgi:hypothetical protein